jgi:TolB-like protein/class 3 adenylate cyclase/Flp pilus assembly protein TadD
MRRLSAIMFTDLAGFTAHTRRDEAGALALVEEQDRLFRSVLTAHRGRRVKSTGDGLLVEFPNALAAVECAVELQRAAHERNRREPSAPLRVRIGLHLGDVERKGGDILGDAVNVASRIEPLAEPGGVCLTAQVYDQVHHRVPYQIERAGAQRVKGLADPVDVYRVRLPWLDGEAPVPGGPVERLAVLPLANISPDPKDDYFADGLTEELIAVLSQIPTLRVIARTSIGQYRGAAKPAGQIGRELGVGSLLEGSVRKAGDQLRITLQLVDARTEEPRWAQRFDRRLDDVFAIQEEISQRVAEALRVRLAPAQEERPPVHATANTEAYTHYLRGRYFWNRSSSEWLPKALQEFARAAELDPGYGAAYAGLADTYLLQGRRGDVPPKEAYPKAVENALRALELEPDLAEPHAALGSIRQEYEWRWRDSEAEFRQALGLNPSYATARAWYALFLGHVGRFDEAVAQAKKAQELDPLSPRIHAGAAEEYIFARQFEGAVGAAERALEIDPAYGAGYAYRAQARVEQGLFDEAIADLERAGKYLGAQACMGRLGHALARAGRTEEARRMADELVRLSPPAGSANPFLAPSPYASLDVGLVHLGLADIPKCLDWLERARDERVPEVVHFTCEPIYDPLQREPRFRAIVESIGLGGPGS